MIDMFRNMHRLCSYELQFVFIVHLGLVFMGRHKCEAVACLSSQVKCNFYELLYSFIHLFAHKTPLKRAVKI